MLLRVRAVTPVELGAFLLAASLLPSQRASAPRPRCQSIRPIGMLLRMRAAMSVDLGEFPPAASLLPSQRTPAAQPPYLSARRLGLLLRARAATQVENVLFHQHFHLYRLDML